MKKEFEFSGLHRLWGGILTLLFLGLWLVLLIFFVGLYRAALPSARPEILLIGLVVSLSCWIFISIGLYLFIASSGRVLLTEEAIILERFQRQKRVRYQDIVQSRQLFGFLILSAPDAQLWIYKQIQNYPELYTLLSQRLPTSPREAKQVTLPLTIRGKISEFIVYGAAVALLLVFAIIVGWSPTHFTGSLILAGLIIVSLIAGAGVIGYLFLLKRPWQYTFAASQIVVYRVLGKQLVDPALIKAIRLDKTTVTSRGFDQALYRIIIELNNNQKLEIAEVDITYSLEQLFEILQHHYKR